MTADLTPQGDAAVRLAQKVARITAERDRARAWAVALEQRLARVEALAHPPGEPLTPDAMVEHAGRWSHTAGLQCSLCPGYPHLTCISAADLRAVLEADQ